MRYIVLATCLFLTSSVFSQEKTKQIVCIDVKKAFEILKQEYDESIFLILEQDGSATTNIALTMNPATKSWSLVEFDDKKGCLLGGGADFKVRPIGKRNIL